MELDLAAEFLLLDVRSASPSARNKWRDFALKLILRVVISLKYAMQKDATKLDEGWQLPHPCRISRHASQFSGPQRRFMQHSCIQSNTR